MPDVGCPICFFPLLHLPQVTPERHASLFSDAGRFTMFISRR